MGLVGSRFGKLANRGLDLEEADGEMNAAMADENIPEGTDYSICKLQIASYMFQPRCAALRAGRLKVIKSPLR